MNQQEEFSVKHKRVSEYLSAHSLQAVVLSARPNFAWLTAGKLNYVNAAAQGGVATLIVTPNNVFCLTNTIERPRIADEELTDLPVEFIDHPWFDNAERTKTLQNIVGGKKVAFDVPVGGLPDDATALDGRFDMLRWELLPPEIERYRAVGQIASTAIEATIHQIKPQMSEFQIAGIASNEVLSRTARPWVILIAVDDRISKYRHPIPTDATLKKTAMVVLCVEKFGLICSLTRLVHFGALDSERRRKHDAVVKVDAIVNLSSTPGKTFGEIFETARSAYKQVGFADEWTLHHQGGPTGYTPRDGAATPGDPRKLVPNQALAWNPSITGTKSEDTVIITGGEPIVLTQAGKDWPMIPAEHAGRTMPRPDILVVS